MQKAFLHDQDPAGKEVLFNRLLSPVIAQLAAELPDELKIREVDGVASQGGDVDVAGQAVVGALVQMGASSGSEGLLKPLHHQARALTDTVTEHGQPAARIHSRWKRCIIVFAPKGRTKSWLNCKSCTVCRVSIMVTKGDHVLTQNADMERLVNTR